MDKKKVVLYTVIIVAALTVSLLFSLMIDRMFGKATYGQIDGSDVSGQGITKDESVSEKDISNYTAILPNTAESVGKNTGAGEDSSAEDIRISDEAITKFYENRNRGDDLDDRYDRLAVEALFGNDCGELEKDRIALVRQLRGYLENTVKDGKDVRSVSVYRKEKEYFVRADIAGVQKDFHIIRYEGAYDFESVFVPSDE